MIPEIVKSNGTVLCMTGLDDACIGYLETSDGMVLAYSHADVIRCLKENNSWDDEEANEWFDYNIANAYGKGFPVVVYLNPSVRIRRFHYRGGTLKENPSPEYKSLENAFDEGTDNG